MDGEVYFVPDLFNPEQSTNYFNALMEKADWQQKQVEMYGKKLNVPRLTAWYGPSNKPYIYSGIKNEPTPWLPELLEIKKKVDEATGLCFTSVLLNLYRDGKDSVAWHRDNEHVLGKNPVIASVNFGATRLFKLRHFEDKKLVKNFNLTPGSFLLMASETQHKWEHAVPKTAQKIGPRINLTFRII